MGEGMVLVSCGVRGVKYVPVLRAWPTLRDIHNEEKDVFHRGEFR